MKNLILIFFLIVTLPQIIISQDRDIENNFFEEKESIKENKIRVIQQYVKSKYSDRDIQYKYKFDINGNLIELFEFYSKDEGIRKQTTYKYNDKGSYNSKKYQYYERGLKTNGILKKRDWLFMFDDNKNRIEEQLLSEEDNKTPILINRLKYDDNGNLIQQIRENGAMWNFYYDEQNKLVKQENFIFRDDSFNLSIITCYKYNNQNKLMEKVKISPKSSKQKLINQITFSYELDTLGNLISIEERTKDFKFTESDKIFSITEYEYNTKQQLLKSTELKKNWSFQMNKIPQRRQRIEVTTYLYNDMGNIIKKCLNTKGEDEPYRCYEYIYEYKN